MKPHTLQSLEIAEPPTSIVDVRVLSYTTMAVQCWDVNIFVINSEGTITPKFPKSVKLKLEYDPQGLCLKAING